MSTTINRIYGDNLPELVDSPVYVDFVLENLKKYAALKNDSAIAIALQVAPSNVSTWRKRGTVPFREILIYCIKQNISFEQVLFGEEHQPTLINSGELADSNHSNFAYIPRYDVKVSAGSGTEPTLEQIKHHAAYRKEWVKQKGLKKENLALVEVSGESMEPQLSDGDTVLINTADKDIRGGSAYVIRVGGDLVVKYLERLPGDVIQVSSANKMYQPYSVKMEKVQDEFCVLGRVVNSTREWR